MNLKTIDFLLSGTQLKTVNDPSSNLKTDYMLNGRMLTSLSAQIIFKEFISEKLNKIFNEGNLDKSQFSE